jgi:hypothetical protein
MPIHMLTVLHPTPIPYHQVCCCAILPTCPCWGHLLAAPGTTPYQRNASSDGTPATTFIVNTHVADSLAEAEAACQKLGAHVVAYRCASVGGQQLCQQGVLVPGGRPALVAQLLPYAIEARHEAQQSAPPLSNQARRLFQLVPCFQLQQHSLDVM